MKKIIFVTIILISFVFILAGCSSPQDEKQQIDVQNNTESKPTENLAFDIDLSSLSYELPSYSKICIPKTKQYCTSDGECKKTKAGVFVLYNENNNMVYRCDNNPCDGFEVEAKESNMFLTLSPIEPNGTLYKLSVDNKYVETVSLGLDMYISHGSCK